MARGERSEGNLRRQVGRTTWQGTGIWNVSDSSLGTLRGYNSEDMEGHVGTELGVWEGEKGHTAEVRHHEWGSSMSGRPELQETNYTAGPFRSQLRAQIAAPALRRRAVRGEAEEYR